MADEKASDHGGTLNLTWKDLCLDITSGGLFTTSKTVRTLRNACGFARPGESLAIIGPSGAGKTTLLDILAQQKSLGKVSGDIQVNGKNPDRFFGRRAGYIFTAMAHIPTMTVKEAVLFAAECRMPRSATHAERLARTDEVIRNLRLTNAADTYIGDELIRGVSTGEKKRLEVAIEMVARPKALFFDEPTSGLDDYGARFTMELVLDYVRREMVTVLVVIHQPAESLFNLFDNVCLVGEQGRICYFGSRAQIEPHFASYGYPTPALTNPIEHYLDVMALDAAKCCDFYEKSPLYQSNLREIERINALPGQDAPHYKYMVERSPWDQFKLIWDRCWVRYWRNPSTSWGRATLFILFAVLFGLVFLNLTPDIGGLRNRLSVASTLSFLPIFISVAAVPQFLEDRELYIQEYNSAFYHLWPFWITYLVIEAIYNVVISTIQYVIIFYMCAGFPSSKWAPAYGMLLVQMVLATCVSLAWSAWCKTLFQAYTALWATGLVFYAFSGAQADLKAVRPWIRWMADLNYWRWAQQYVDWVLLGDYLYACDQLPASLFVNGVVAGARGQLLNSVARDNSTQTVTAATNILGTINSLTAVRGFPSASPAIQAQIDAVIAGLSTAVQPLLPPNASVDVQRSIATSYGAFDAINTQLKADDKILGLQEFCALGQGADWLYSFRGIGVGEPAITAFAYLAQMGLLVLFAALTYFGLWFSRSYRKR